MLSIDYWYIVSSLVTRPSEIWIWCIAWDKLSTVSAALLNISACWHVLYWHSDTPLRPELVMDILFFPYFSCLFLSHSLHLCLHFGFSCFLHAVIILSHRHFFISLFMWLMGMSPWSRSPAQLPFPTFISALCKAMLFISASSLPCYGYATAFLISVCFHSQGYSPHVMRSVQRKSPY